MGEDAVKELRQQGAMPKDLDDPEVQDYVNTIAQRIAKKLRSPGSLESHRAGFR